MSDEDSRVREILRHNAGFDEPDAWIDYARRHRFKPVAAVGIPRCPDCSSAPGGAIWGQYVYYSTLIRLLDCPACGLVWADVHLHPDVIRQHFERAYKDDHYFRESRRAIFEHLASVVDALAPVGGQVLDVGGARGDLMAEVVSRRPDLSATVHDLSSEATDWARDKFGLATLTGDAHHLSSHTGQYDVVVLSDVMYYEPNLSVLWSALRCLVRPGGSIVIRIPNKTWLMKLGQVWSRLVKAPMNRGPQDRVPFYNPEHIFVFRRRYLLGRLRSIGFGQIRFTPSPLLIRGKFRLVDSGFCRVASMLSWVSLGSLVLTPSMLVIGSRYDPS